MPQTGRRRLAFSIALLVCLCGTARHAVAVTLRSYESRHYHVETDLDDELARDCVRRMDAMYDEYARRLAAFRPADDVPRLRVYLYAKQKDYLTYTGDKMHNTGGVYIPSRNALAAFLEGQGRDGLRRTLQHEAFHQFAFNVISRDLPAWLNEGMAQIFEEAIWTGDGFWLGHVPPRRIRQLTADLQKNRTIRFELMLTMSPERWAMNLSESGELGATQYNQSWAMVHFLTFVADAQGNPLHRARLINMLRLLHEGKEGVDAFQEAFSSNIRGFEDRFMEYAQTLRPTTTASLIERQSVLADLLAELDRRGQQFPTLTQFKRAVIDGGYRMHYTKGELTWETDKDLTVYFSDLTGRVLLPDELFFERRFAATLPDIVCRCDRQYQLRTRFYRTTGRLEQEILVEPPGTRLGEPLGRAE